MSIKSKDIVQLTDIGEKIIKTLPLFEYRIAENLTEPMKVNQIYKKVIDKYPNDYLDGSLNFYKNMEILESKKILEKVVFEKEDLFSDYFNESLTEVEMSTVSDDNVDIVNRHDLNRKENRRTDRWFKLNKNKFKESDDSLIVKKEKTQKLNYQRFLNKEVDDEDGEIYLPLENPFVYNEINENGEVKSFEKIHSNENNEGIVISFIKKENEESENLNKRKPKTKTRIDREKYKKSIQKERFGDKKFKRLKEKNEGVFFNLKKIVVFIKKILTR